MGVARFLLDSNVLSEELKPKPNASLVKRIKTHHLFCVTATVVWQELWLGYERLPDSPRKLA